MDDSAVGSAEGYIDVRCDAPAPGEAVVEYPAGEGIVALPAKELLGWAFTTRGGRLET